MTLYYIPYKSKSSAHRALDIICILISAFFPPRGPDYSSKLKGCMEGNGEGEKMKHPTIRLKLTTL